MPSPKFLECAYATRLMPITLSQKRFLPQHFAFPPRQKRFPGQSFPCPHRKPIGRWVFVADLLVLDSPTLREDNDEANDLVFASVRKLVSRANRSQERRVEDLRR